MHKILKKLYRDHAHFSQLMEILEQQLGTLKSGSKSAPGLLQEVIRYSHDYADDRHHPVEDQLYEYMLARTDEGREVMEDLLVQHLQIDNMTLKLRQELEKPLSEATDKLIQLGQEYVQKQRQHMQVEEKEAFPLFRKVLGDQDFENAVGAIPAVEDPMEDTNFLQQYPALHAYLDRHSS